MNWAKTSMKSIPPNNPGHPGHPGQPAQLERSYDLFTGGRAIEENLQLDRLLPTDESGAKPTVELDSIAGITVPEFDWAPLIEDIRSGDKPENGAEIDPLAKLIPDDQHAVFFPSFQAMLDVADHTNAHGTPVLEAVEPRAEDRWVRQWYERQLCLPASTLARLLGHEADRLGRDHRVRPLPAYRQRRGDPVRSQKPPGPGSADHRPGLTGPAGHTPGVEKIEGEFDGVAYTGMQSPDRAICSYVATLGDTIVVTNTPAQLQRLVKVSNGDIGSLAALPEYVYFRHRYNRDDPRESAFLMLSDKTIRRWCGPRWRIASSRRTRAAAA